MGKEIEIRYKLNNKRELEEWLNKNAKIIHTSHQIDTYYDNKLNSFAKDPEHIYDWLRVREENDNITLNYKHWLPEGEIIRTYCDENELTISSAEEMKKILCNLGFEVFIVVDKLRNIWLYKDYEISIDTVKQLGDYIEIEYKGKETTDIDNIMKSLHDTLGKINANVGEEDHGGYGFKLIKKRLNG